MQTKELSLHLKGQDIDPDYHQMIRTRFDSDNNDIVGKDVGLFLRRHNRHKIVHQKDAYKIS